MFAKLLRFIKRPEINEQNTGRLAFQQYQGYSFAGVNGDAGFGVRYSPSPLNPANIAIGPSHKLNDPTATGNPSDTVILYPLQEDNGAQF